jgi:hypothetical protein
MASTAKPKALGITPGGISTTEAFCAGMGWGRKAFVAARRRGLPVRKVSRRIYIINDEAVEWFKSQTGAST